MQKYVFHAVILFILLGVFQIDYKNDFLVFTKVPELSFL